MLVRALFVRSRHCLMRQTTAHLPTNPLRVLLPRSSSFSSSVKPIPVQKNHTKFSQSKASLCEELHTVRDFLRYASQQFQRYKLAYGQCTTTAEEDAVFLVMRSLNLPVDRTHPHLSTLLSLSQKNLILERIEARIKKRIPVAYLLQEAVFHGDFYYVDANVLIPRSFIGEILRNPDYISQPSSPSSSSSSSSKGKKLIEADKVASILDLCTGSGCLAVLSSRVFVNAATIHAVDNSPACVNIAKKNIESLHLQKKISAYLGDLFSFKEVRQYDLIICNPPYVDAGTLRRLPPEYQHEPSSALGAGKDGLEILHRILTQASQYLTENGVLICEVGRRSGDVYKHYPRLATKLIWLDTELSEGEVFLAKRADLASHIATPDRMAGEMR